MNKSILILLFLVTSFRSYSQSNFIKELRSIDHSTEINDAIELRDGSIVCLGYVDDPWSQGRIYVSKFTASLSPLWTHSFGEWESWLSDEPMKIFETLDSGIMVLCRSSHSDINGDYSDGMLLIKYNSNGDTVFQKRYQGDFWGAFDMYEFADGSLMCIVHSNEYQSDSSSIHIIKFDMNGNTSWIKSFRSRYFVKARQILPFENSYIIYGSTQFPDTTNIYSMNNFLMKMDTSGNLIWARSFKVPNSPISPFKMIVLHNGMILTIGKNGADNRILMSFDSSGMPLTTKRTDAFIIEDWALNNDSTLDLLGLLQDGFHHNIGNFILKTNLLFDTLSSFQLPNANNIDYFPQSIYRANDQGLLISAFNWNFYYDSSFFLIKIDSLYFNNCTSPITYAIPWSNDSVITSTMTMEADTLQLYYLFNYPYFISQYSINSVNELCNFTSMHEVNKKVVTIFPNPFHSEAKLEFGNLEMVNGTLKIYNSIGALIRKDEIANLNSYIFHRDDLPNGLYFFHLSTLDPAAPSGSRAGSQLIGSGKFIVE